MKLTFMLHLILSIVIHAQQNPLAPSSPLSNHDVRERILKNAWEAAEGVKDGDIAELSQQIQELKRQLNPDEVKLQELEEQRILMLRQRMLVRQFRITPERIHTEF